MQDKKTFSKIVNHPDRDEIIQKLLAGESTRQIEAWLKKKYPNRKNKHVSYATLQAFRKQELNLEGEVLAQVAAERKKERALRKAEEQSEVIQSTQVYQQGLSTYVQDSLIDYNSEILEMLQKLKGGIDKLEQLDEAKGSHLNHQAIVGYLAQIKAVMEMHRKMVAEQEKKAGDNVAEEYEILQRKMDILTSAVKEAFTLTNPEGLPIFMDIVREKFKEEGVS